MTLLDAPAYDVARAKRRKTTLISIVVVLLVAPVFVIAFWNWPSEYRVNLFFNELEHQNYPKAYGVWNNDAQWQAHKQQFTQYPYSRFLVDWGPSSEYGHIRGHKIVYATSHLGNVVLIVVRVYAKTTSLLTLSVSKSGHTIDFSPFDLAPGPKRFGFTRWIITRHF